jgi:hypothetical protein
LTRFNFTNLLRKPKKTKGTGGVVSPIPRMRAKGESKSPLSLLFSPFYPNRETVPFIYTSSHPPLHNLRHPRLTGFREFPKGRNEPGGKGLSVSASSS